MISLFIVGFVWVFYYVYVYIFFFLTHLISLNVYLQKLGYTRTDFFFHAWTFTYAYGNYCKKKLQNTAKLFAGMTWNYAGWCIAVLGVFLYSVISGLNMLTQGEPRLCVSMCVCVCVCVSVCVSVTASHFHNTWPILMKLGPCNLIKKMEMTLFSGFGNFDLMTS